MNVSGKCLPDSYVGYHADKPYDCLGLTISSQAAAQRHDDEVKKRGVD